MKPEGVGQWYHDLADVPENKNLRGNKMEPIVEFEVTNLDNGAKVIGRKVVWVAYHGDWSDMVVFFTEIDALRYAVEHHMEVKKVPDGESIRFWKGANQ